MHDLLNTVRAVLRTTPPRWRALVESLPDDLLTRPAAPGEWSAVECLQHLIDTEQHVFPARVQAFLEGRDFAAFDPDTQGSQPSRSPAEMATFYTQLREQNLGLLDGLTEADLDRRARHSELGEVTLGELLHEWAAHDLSHTVQAEEALMQPFMDGCGPWRRYFAAHEVAREV